MKGGIAAAVEALRALRATGLLAAGEILLTAHDHHEGPWGDRRQVRALIRAGYVGDAVMLPEYLADRLPVAGRGMAIFQVRIARPGEPMHEVLRPPGLPDVLGAGARLVIRLAELHAQVRDTRHPVAGHDSVFVGHLQSGEIYNQAPTLCVIDGTRRWVTPGLAEAAHRQFQEILAELAAATSCTVDHDFDLQGEAFQVDPETAVVQAFQAAQRSVTGATLPLGAKPFVDDGNTFAGLAGIPALTHGPAGTGAHTVDERVAVAELVRVARVYALTAIGFCVP
jgi:acetylornithine deacetylase/succinyl-diaminopimelate desuccinylase-like protein